MTDELSSRLRPVKLGMLFSLLAILFGFGLGGAFGLYEDGIKGHLKAEAEAVKDTVYKGGEAADEASKAKVAASMKKITDKSWVYVKRAHMHGGAIGAVGLAVCLMLALLTTCGILKFLSATTLGVGSLGYSVFWLLAALRAPGLGSTSAAKESLTWLAQPTAALCLVGLVLAMLAFCHGCLCRCGCKAPTND